MRTRDENSLKMEFPARSVNEGFARAAVASFAAQMDPDLEQLGDLKTVVSEAVTNCIVHAYPDSIGKIAVTCRVLKGGVFEVRVRDWGKGIDDVELARTPSFTTGGGDRSGMGFTIMESFTDGLAVRSRPGGGTTVILRKCLGRKTARR